jgi:hypothetical protein
MPQIPDVPLTSEASALVSRLRTRIRERFAAIRRMPVGVLIWGPGIESPSPLAAVRQELRRALRMEGHAALFSEELTEEGSTLSLRTQQFTHALECDLIVSLPCTPSAIAELHDFATDLRISSKTLVFLDQSQMEGYASQSLESTSTINSCRVKYYPNDQETSMILKVTLSEAQKIREMKYEREERY